jgi:hypothetical protein
MVDIQNISTAGNFTFGAGDFSYGTVAYGFGTGAYGFGTAAPTTRAVDFAGNFTLASDTSPKGFYWEKALTAGSSTTAFTAFQVSGSMTTQGASATLSRVGTLLVSEPDITLGTGDSIDDAYSLRVAIAPTEGTRNWSVWVDAGTSRFDGDIGTSSFRIPKIWTTNQDTTNAENVSCSVMSKAPASIRPYDRNALDVIADVDVVTFKHLDELDPSGREKLGVVAESIGDPLITPEKEYPTGKGPGVDMLGLAALSVRGIQELQAENRLLRKRIEALEAA